MNGKKDNSKNWGGGYLLEVEMDGKGQFNLSFPYQFVGPLYICYSLHCCFTKHIKHTLLIVQ